MLSYTTLETFDSWKGSTKCFILNWQDQVRLCKLLVDADTYFSQNQKKIILENVITSVKPLCSFKDQSDRLFTYTGELLCYDQYNALLLSAATNYDSQFVSASSRSTRKVCNVELGGSNFEIDSPSEVTEDA